MDEHLARMRHAPSQLPSQHTDTYFPELDLAMIECFEQFKLPGLPSIALYMPEPLSTVYVVPLPQKTSFPSQMFLGVSAWCRSDSDIGLGVIR